MKRATPPSGVATHVAFADLSVTMLTGAEARATLASAAFREEWRALVRSCPWATVFQGPAFCDIWWQVYGERHDPLLLLGRRHEGPLRGLLMLARERTSGELAHVGTHHAEYHAWLASPGDSDAFMLGVLRLLHDQRSCRTLRFMYVAPGAPVAWTAALGRSATLGVFSTNHTRGRRLLGPDDRAGSQLKKKSTRSKLKRLERIQPTSFSKLTRPEELDHWLPQIKSQCDARHRDGNGLGPFARDALKEALFRRLFGTSGMLHACVLTRGEQLLASHIGFIDHDAVILGLFTHAHAERQNSPGKLLLHMLVQQLALEQYRSLDLTPGDDYKMRFANETTTTAVIEVRFGLLHTTRGRIREAARRLVRSASGRARIAPDVAESRMLDPD